MTTKADLEKILGPDVMRAIEACGHVLVPLEPTSAMLGVLDDEGTAVWGGGTEHFFPSRECGHDYARDVWRRMVSLASTTACT